MDETTNCSSCPRCRLRAGLEAALTTDAPEPAGVITDALVDTLAALRELRHDQPVKSKEELLDELRRKCNQQAFRLSKLAECDVKEIHCKFRPQKDMTEAELRAKLAAILTEAADYA
jgi:hypothetical protein